MDKKFEENLNSLGIKLTEKQQNQFLRYYELLTEWNKVMNLTSITDYDEVCEKHFVDSLCIVKALDLTHVDNLIDIGTGAGFPGIPLKIVFPHLKITLLDSLNKRIRFLQAVTEELELEEVETLHGRAEDFAKDLVYREKYQLCVSRAVANLAVLSEYCIPYVMPGGKFVSYKSGEIEEELNQSEKAVRLLGGKASNTEKFCLPGSDIRRSLVLIEKVKQTPKKFPRKAGLPAKEPLK